MRQMILRGRGVVPARLSRNLYFVGKKISISWAGRGSD
jgi:hypothetical protein